MDISYAIVIITIIVILILRSSFKNKNSWIYKTFMRLPPSEGMAQVAWDGFLFFGSLTFAILLANIMPVNTTEAIAMTNIWHNALIIALLFFFWAVIITIRIKMKPKDNRLDELTKQITTLTIAINELKDSITEKQERKIIREEINKNEIEKYNRHIQTDNMARKLAEEKQKLGLDKTNPDAT